MTDSIEQEHGFFTALYHGVLGIAQCIPKESELWARNNRILCQSINQTLESSKSA